MGVRTGRGLLAVLVAAVGVSLCGCAGGAATGAAAAGSGQAVAAAATKGCPANSVRPPKVEVGPVGDVDGDGRADRQFYSHESPAYGIRTASGATIVLHDNLPAPNQHGGWTAKVGSSFITVIDDGQTAEVFRFAGCRFVPVTTRYGLPFLSVLSGGYGVGDNDLVRYGLTCTGSGAKRTLANVIAVKQDDGTWSLNAYLLRTAGTGSLAQEQEPSKVVRRLTASDRRIQDASLSMCGTDRKVYSDGR